MVSSRIIFAACRTPPTDISIDCDDVANKLTLQSYLQQVIKDSGGVLTLGAISRNSKRGDSGISKDYVSGLVLGEYDQPSPDKIVALARGINRPLEEVIDVIFGKVKANDVTYRDVTIRSLLAEFNALPAPDQKELKPMIDMFLQEVRRRASRTNR